MWNATLDIFAKSHTQSGAAGHQGNTNASSEILDDCDKKLPACWSSFHTQNFSSHKS